MARVGHGDGPAQGRVGGQQRVHGGIDARDEEGGDARHGVERLARGQPPFEPGEVRLGHALVNGHAEEERDVHVHARRDQLRERLHARGRARRLDHGVRAVHQPEEAQGLGHGGLAVVREVRRRLQRDVAVRARRGLVHGPQRVRGHADVLAGEGREGGVRVRLARGDDGLQGLLVVARFGDGLVEDGGVGGHARDQARPRHAPDFAGDEQPATDVVEPDALAVLAQPRGGVRHGFPARRATRAAARSATASAVKP